jgi:hypothetical protein
MKTFEIVYREKPGNVLTKFVISAENKTDAVNRFYKYADKKVTEKTDIEVFEI